MRTAIGVALAGTALAAALPSARADDAAPGSGKAAKPVAYRKVATKNYTIEVPQGWQVTDESPFGQREMHPESSSDSPKGASMSSMTGPGLGSRSWDDLYKTSLYYITRYSPDGKRMKAGAYKVSRSKLGFETCSWSMTDTRSGKVLQRHVILKDAKGNILALSVRVPTDAAGEPKQRLEVMFQHMVDTAALL